MTNGLAVLLAVALAQGQAADPAPLTLPMEKRPAWLADEGIVMAGSWEPLLFRVRRDGSEGYTPTPQQLANYQTEHSPEMVRKLKDLGVNFIMMHCYKGFGLQAEHESMQDAVRFARLCHEAGLRVGVYVHSGTLGWELLYKELPEAADWVVLNKQGQPVTYGRAQYRYYFDRNNPEAQAFFNGIVRFAVQDIGTDLLHFDNYITGPGTEPNALRRFQRYLANRFTPKERSAMGAGPELKLPLPSSADPVLQRAWIDFSCSSLAESYHQVSQYARTLRPDILLEMNPGGPGERIRPPADTAGCCLAARPSGTRARSPALPTASCVRGSARTRSLGG